MTSSNSSKEPVPISKQSKNPPKKKPIQTVLQASCKACVQMEQTCETALSIIENCIKIYNDAKNNCMHKNKDSCCCGKQGDIQLKLFNMSQESYLEKLKSFTE